ncbi:hypothetical protein ACFGD2_012145 [Citrobacter freundii]
MTSREKFEAWMTAEQWFHGSDFEWDERRNCYAQFGIHLAYKAFMAAEGAAEQNLTDMAVQLANAESKCRELAAENAALKEVVSGVNSELYGQGFEVSGWHLNGALEPLDNWFTDNGWGMPETPATEAFLAEVRAQGVEMFGQYHNFSEKLLIQKEAQKFAARLRKGAAL